MIWYYYHNQGGEEKCLKFKIQYILIFKIQGFVHL